MAKASATPQATNARMGMIVRLADMAVMIVTRLPDRWLAYSISSQAGWVPVCVKKMRRSACQLTSLQPADAPEPPEQGCAYQQYRADYAKIAVFPIQFRHVLEVHPVDA